jgi:chemotaxis methyl-accepting protein methylase
VIGTDLNAESLDVARKGWYESATSLPAQYAGRYLLPWRQGYLVSEEIRSHVTFHRHNLVFSGAPRGIDIVSCRNVLYYLNESERFRAVRALWEAMNPLSFLVIGNSETLAGWSSLFKRLSMRGATIYRRQGVSDSAPPAGDADFRAS